MKKTYDIVGKTSPAARRLKSGKMIYENNYQSGIKCRLCYKVSYDPLNIKEKYCGNCSFYHSNDWQNDQYILFRIKTDKDFSMKIKKAVLLYKLHLVLGKSAQAVIMSYRTVYRLFFPPKKV